MSTEHWTDADDRALARHAAWDRHVREAMRQSRPADRLDELVTEDAEAMTERHATVADAVHRRDGLGFTIAAVLGVLAFAVVLAVVILAVPR